MSLNQSEQIYNPTTQNDFNSNQYIFRFRVQGTDLYQQKYSTILWFLHLLEL